MFVRIFLNNPTVVAVTLNVNICLRGREWGWGVEKLVLRYVVLNGWPQTNVVKYFLYIGTAKYTKVSPPARKMLFSSIIITIILSYTIIRIYAILHIYLQISETELQQYNAYLINCGFELQTHELELVTHEFELVIHGFEFVTRGFEVVTRGFELVTCGFELALLNFNLLFQAVNLCFYAFNS